MLALVSTVLTNKLCHSFCTKNLLAHFFRSHMIHSDRSKGFNNKEAAKYLGIQAVPACKALSTALVHELLLGPSPLTVLTCLMFLCCWAPF